MKLSNDMRQGQFNVVQYLRKAKKAKNPTKTAGAGKGSVLWIALLAGVGGLLLGFDLATDLLEELISVLLEFVQECLESFYHKQCRLDLYHAQMATAYTGFVVMMGVGYFFINKMSIALKAIREGWDIKREKAMDVCLSYWSRLMDWWNSMDNFNKCFALIGFVVVAIPLVSLACVVLGKAVAELV